MPEESRKFMISLLEEIREFRAVAEVLYVKGWAEASAGNMSLRLSVIPPAIGRLVPDPQRIHEADLDMSDLIGDYFLVTGSGTRMRDIANKPEKGLCLIKILDDRCYWLLDGGKKLSSEWPTHAGLHALFKENRSGERAVLHCHPLSLIALSHIFSSEKEMNERLFRMQHETRLFVPEMVGLIPYAVTGSASLAKASRDKLNKFRLALWDKHGVIAGGESLNQALDRIEVVEKAAAIYLQLKSLGIEPDGLSDEQIAATIRAFEK
jgi:rhamnulose-1-phosphate aldolase